MISAVGLLPKTPKRQVAATGQHNERETRANNGRGSAMVAAATRALVRIGLAEDRHTNNDSNRNGRSHRHENCYNPAGHCEASLVSEWIL
jgi:hypothetical protein